MASKRTEEMTSFIVMDVLEKAHEMERVGIDVIHLEVGEPDFDVPQCVNDAIREALDEGDTHIFLKILINSYRLKPYL